MRKGTEPLAAKVPEITVMFWVLKILTTGMGEAMSDFMGQHSVPVAGLVGVFGTLFAFRLQYRRREYHAPTYWFTVMMVAIFGTMVADGIKDGLGLSYAVTTPFFAAVVVIVFCAGSAARARWTSTRSPLAGARTSTGRRSWRPSRSAPPRVT